jgi:hypothetical protein
MVGHPGRKSFAFQELHSGAPRPARVHDEVPEHGGAGGRKFYQSQLEVAVGRPGVVNGDRQLTTREAPVALMPN